MRNAAGSGVRIAELLRVGLRRRDQLRQALDASLRVDHQDWLATGDYCDWREIDPRVIAWRLDEVGGAHKRIGGCYSKVVAIWRCTQNFGGSDGPACTRLGVNHNGLPELAGHEFCGFSGNGVNRPARLERYDPTDRL